MTPADWVALWERQGKVCAVCGGPPPPSGTMHTDHLHKRGYAKLPAYERKELVRGLIHFRCNVSLRGWITVEWLRGALAYLEAFEERLTKRTRLISITTTPSDQPLGEPVTFKAGGGGKFFRPDNGNYFGEFIGTAEGRTWDRTRELEDGTEEKYQAPSIEWLFKLTRTDGSAVMDPNTGEQAVGQGNTGVYLTWSGKGTEPKARVWARALAASKGIVFEDDLVNTDEKANAFVASLYGTKVQLQFGKSPQAKTDGTLLTVSPVFGGVAA